jgi:hypothetical protein
MQKEMEIIAEGVTVLVLPGLNSSGPQHWQTRWEQTDPSFRRVRQKDWETPQFSDWIEEISREVARTQPPILFAAHSLGSIALAHWAQAASPELVGRIKGALIVAPADVDRPGVPQPIKNFAPVPRGRLPFASVIVASSDDPHVSLARAREFAGFWGSRFVDIGPADHIATNMGDWPEGKRLLRELIDGSSDRTGPASAS